MALPNVEELQELLGTADDIEFFFDQLNSASWIPVLHEGGYFADPPLPLEEGNGLFSFPGWSASRYLVRVADQAPDEVADLLLELRASTNPRVWWDTVDALIKVPVARVEPFVPDIRRWAHRWSRLGLDQSVGQLIHHVATLGGRGVATVLGRDLLALVPPEDWEDTEDWHRLEDYDYGELARTVALDLATFGTEPIFALVDELERFLDVDRAAAEGTPGDYSYIWRPAIENNEQNGDYEPEAKLVTALRDAFAAVIARDPGAVGPIAEGLLGRRWQIARRLGLHVLVEHGDLVPDIIDRVLTERAFIDETYRHELYRLVERRFGEAVAEARQAFLANVRIDANDWADRIVAAKAEGSPTLANADPDQARKWSTRRWLNVVKEYLSEADRAELDALNAELPIEEHPEFASFHSSWSGTTSPASADELLAKSDDELIIYLATWEQTERFGPHPSIDGLANAVTEAAEREPARLAAITPRFVDLNPDYLRGLLFGLKKAIEADQQIAWAEVLNACLTVLEGPVEKVAEGSHDAWRSLRMGIVWLLERAFDDRPGQLPLDLRETAWRVISLLAGDVEPAPASEDHYGATDNVGPVT
jgi:hypothetical protein